MRKSYIRIVFSVVVVALFLFSSGVNGITKNSEQFTSSISPQENPVETNNAVITCYLTGVPRSQEVSSESAVYFQKLFSSLAIANSRNPNSVETQRLEQEILVFAGQNGLLPLGMSADRVLDQMDRYRQHLVSRDVPGNVVPLGVGREALCNFVATGEGAAFPIIILPRFIPFVMAPIPRLFVGWKTSIGFTSCGGLLSGTGFYAVGDQQGFALGFWGIGFSIFLPPVRVYGMFGYALFAKATAEYIEYYPPNHAPEITQTNPVDGAQMVPLSTSELQFEIHDVDGDLMTYEVTTDPDVGSGSGGLKPDGVYTVPVSGLESLTQYTWTIEVSDGLESVEKTLTFTTEPVAPVISNPSPGDGEQQVSADLLMLSFTLKDYQGDLMDYTVETYPFIGSASGSLVGDGHYTVPITGVVNAIAYTWYVNVTDGTYWTRKVFTFETVYPAVFDPFEYGWQYRKQIMVDHTKVYGDLVNFPVLVSIMDTDLCDAAQGDGDDILFMASSGVSVKLNHEIESFESSTGTLVAWVNLSSLSSLVDTMFYVYYGNPDCLSKENVEHTWDDCYKGVYHMNDLTTSMIGDSTVNDKDGVKSAVNKPMEVTGKIGNAQDFESSTSDVIRTNSVFADWSTTETEVTISCWIKPESFPDFESDVYHWAADGEMQFKFKPNQTLCWGVDLTTGWVFEYSPPMENGIWYYCVGTWKKNDLSNWYINGDVIVSRPVGNVYCRDTGNQYTPIFGAWRSNTPNYFYDGVTDEFRVSTIERNAGWISTEYNNQYSPATFLNLGPEEPGP